MAIAGKGSRRITVEGTQFRWKVRGRPTYEQGLGTAPLTFVVERSEQPGALLVASLPCAHPDNWMGMRAGVMLPGTVASAIRSGPLAEGWLPSRPGPAFMLESETGTSRRPVPHRRGAGTLTGTTG
jgi:hypothetical protein